MPIKTISPAGGNWNATTTWVGGVIPVNDDVIVGAANSGNLIWNTDPGFRYALDMTNYAATMSINTSFWTLPSNTQVAPLYTTSTFSSQMTIAYSSVSNTARRNNGNQNTTFVFLGDGPFGQFPIISLSQQNQTLTISGTLKADTLVRTNATTTINSAVGGGTMSVRKYDGFSGGGAIMSGTCPIVFERETGEWMNSFNLLGGGVGNPIIINTTGTFSITPTTGYSYGFLGIRANGNLRYINGNIVGQKNLHITNLENTTTVQSNTTATLDLGGSGTWSSIHISDTAATGGYSSTLRNNISLTSDLYFNQLRVQSNNGAASQAYGGDRTFRLIIRFIGSGRLKGGYLRGQTNTISWNAFYNAIPNFNGTHYFVPRIELEPSLPLNTFTGIQLYGIPDNTNIGSSASYCKISSSLGGTKAHISVEEPTTFGVWFSDIDASAGVEVKNYFGIINNTTNITNPSSLPSGGGGESSALYVG